tara:strand:+ start:311 stop:466 length:156 start_codon:yes stop_codon:yes gene_type:complete
MVESYRPFLLNLRVKNITGPDRAYNKKKINKTLGGSKDMKDTISEMANNTI